MYKFESKTEDRIFRLTDNNRTNYPVFSNAY